MATGASNLNLVTSRYAGALIDMADEAKAVEKVRRDLTALTGMIDGSPALQELIDNPLYNRTQHRKAILALAEKAGFDPLTTRFLGVVATNRRLGDLREVIAAVHKELRVRSGEIDARVRTAVAMTAAQKDKLQKLLSEQMGATVVLETEVDKDLIGGMVVMIGSQMVDDSVRRKVEMLGRRMRQGSNENEVQLKEVG